jgi:hypothetical protein
MSKSDAANPLVLVEIEKKNNTNSNTPQIVVNTIQDFTNSKGKDTIKFSPLSKKSTRRTDTLDLEFPLNKGNDNEQSQLKNNTLLLNNVNNNNDNTNNINNDNKNNENNNINKNYLFVNVINENKSINSENTPNSKSRNLLSPNPNQLTNRGKFSTKPSNEMTKIIFKEPPKFLAVKKEDNKNKKAKRTDRNGIEICKKNKKKIKVTFIDKVDENQPLEDIIDIQSIKKYNVCYGLPKGDKYIKETVCCSCIII